MDYDNVPADMTPTETKEIPNQETPVPEQPEPTALTKELPSDLSEENCIQIGDRKVEIKPTKLKYFRNRTASIYSVLKVIPISDFLAYKDGTFDEKRSSDQILYDFLVAVFDDATLVRNYYDEFSADDIERILEIFGRLNHIDEKEEAAKQKNREAQVKP